MASQGANPKRLSFGDVERIVLDAFPPAVVYTSDSSWVDQPTAPVVDDSVLFEYGVIGLELPTAEPEDSDVGETAIADAADSDESDPGSAHIDHVESAVEFMEESAFDYFPDPDLILVALNVVYGTDTEGRSAFVPRDYVIRYGNSVVDDRGRFSDNEKLGDAAEFIWSRFGEIPIDAVPFEVRINPDRAIEAIEKAFPDAEFYTDPSNDLLCVDLHLGVIRGRVYSEDEILDLVGSDRAAIDEFMGSGDSGNPHETTDQLRVRRGHRRKPFYTTTTNRHAANWCARRVGTDPELMQPPRSLAGEERYKWLYEIFRAVVASVDSPAWMNDEESVEAAFRSQYAFISTLIASQQTTTQLVEAGESATVEFKSTARWNIKAGMATKSIEDSIVKTVAAFMNTNGGTLLIGVGDEGTKLGLESDLSLFAGSRDRYENWLMSSLLAGAVGQAEAATLRFMFDGDIVRLDVPPASQPVYATMSTNDMEFFVRIGNATHALSTRDAVSYISENWAR